MSDSATGIDFLDQIRRQQLLQQLQNPDQVGPTIQAAQGQVSPPPSLPQTLPQDQPQDQSQNLPQVPSFDPQQLTNIQQNLPFGQPQIPPTTPVEQAGTRYAQVAGQNIRPQDYPRSKLLTALVAPFMVKQFLRNPMQASENLNVLTRRGYGTAELEHARELEQVKADYAAKREVFKDQMSSATEGIKGNNEWVNLQMKKIEAGVKLPLEVYNEAAKLRETEARTRQILAGQLKTDEPNDLTVTDEKGNVVHVTAFPHITEGRLSWTDASTGQQITGTISDPRRLSTANLTPVEQLFAAGINEYPTTHGGKLPDFKAQQEILTAAQKANNQAQADNKLEQIAAATAAREAEQDVRNENVNVRTLMQDNIRRLDSEVKPLSLQLSALTTTRTAAELGDKNGVAAIMAPIDQVMGGGSKSVARYNSKEFDRILGGAGKWEQFKANVRRYLPGGDLQKSGIPPAVLKQIKELNAVTEREIRRQQQVNDKYRKMVEGATSREDLIGLMGKYDAELGDAQGWRQDAAKLTPQQQLDLINQEIQRRRAAQ